MKLFFTVVGTEKIYCHEKNWFHNDITPHLKLYLTLESST